MPILDFVYGEEEVQSIQFGEELTLAVWHVCPINLKNIATYSSIRFCTYTVAPIHVLQILLSLALRKGLQI